jgi:NitT/TauT family transport system ATP-binding protein
MAKTKIQIRDLTIDYVNEDRGERHRAIESLTLDVRENEFLCVVGPSGCGKSTLIAAIAGFLRPAAGELTMDGRRITGPGADRGVVFQEYALLPWKTVIDNVALGLKFRGIPRAERHEVARRFLRLTNLADAAGKYPHELSGGMKQRAAVARTLANEPEIMLMDEPFAAIDAQTRMTLQEELVGIWTRSRVTVLFVTHSVDEAVFLADRVAVLTANPGRLKAVVPVDIPRSARSWATLNADRAYVTLRDQVLGLVRSDLLEST